MNIYELYGRQAERLQELVQFHGKTMQLLRDIQDGKILPAQLVITQTGWEVQDNPISNVSEFREALA